MSSKARYLTLSVLSCAAVALSAPAIAAAAPTSGSPTPAVSADTGAALAAIKARAAAAIAARLASLNTAIPQVQSNTVITAADKSVLLATLNGDVSGLTALGHTIAADTDAKQAATDAATIYTSYRVYALALPQVRYAEVADDLTGGVLPRLSDAQTKLAALLAGADASKNTPAVQAAMSDLAAKIADATAATSGMSATVLGCTPAQYDANHNLLDGPRQQLVAAQADVKAARADVATVVAALK